MSYNPDEHPMEELFLHYSELERCRDLVLWRAHHYLREGIRYELRYYPDPFASYGKVKLVSLIYNDVIDSLDWSQERWSPGQRCPDGTYLIARGHIDDSTCPPTPNASCTAERRQAVQRVLAVLYDSHTTTVPSDPPTPAVPAASPGGRPR